MLKKIYGTLIILLLIISGIIPSIYAYNITMLNNKTNTEDYSFDAYYVSEIVGYGPNINCEEPNNNYIETKKINVLKKNSESLDGPMDSAWPMYCHDVCHTGRSPYSTADNYGFEKWRCELIEDAKGSPVIDDEGVIYIGATHLYAVYPNGTIKWENDDWLEIFSAPAIDENDVIYVGTIWAMPNYLYAFYTSNGTLKWKYKIGNDDILSSPAIASDGTVYFGCSDHNIYALYPNGTLKWKYETGSQVLSSPAIGDDETIYCGSHDTYLYALYPNNGTVKWKFPTGYYVRVSPCIADDGTIYCVSRDGYLYAVYPNGTMKWNTNVHAGTSPTIGQDGTVYAGWKELYAVNPTDGSVKWTFDPGSDRTIQGGTPCNSVDGTIYFGTSDGGEIIAVNPDGTEKWRKQIGTCESAPAIGEDGTVYVGSRHNMYGYLHAIGPLDPNAPTAPVIKGETNGIAGEEYQYTFKSTSPLGREVYYYIDWSDNTVSDWFGPFSSGEEITESHSWYYEGNYTIKARAKDSENLWGPWSEFEITIPRTRVSYNSLFIRFFNRYPFLDYPLNH